MLLTRAHNIADAKVWISYIYKLWSEPIEGAAYSCAKLAMTSLNWEQRKAARPSVLDQNAEMGRGIGSPKFLSARTGRFQTPHCGRRGLWRPTVKRFKGFFGKCGLAIPTRLKN